MTEILSEEDICDQNLRDERIIQKLLNENVSFSEVAELLKDDVDSEEEESGIQENKAKPRKSSRLRDSKLRRRLPDAALQGLMGEANLCFANGQFDEAVTMCTEIIRQYPKSPEPYSTLVMIYESRNLNKKAHQFQLILAHLSSDSHEWEKLAILAQEENDTQQAIFCLTRAIKYNPHNLDYHWKRCKLYHHNGDRNKALKGYMHMVKFLPEDQESEKLGLELARTISKMHYENDDMNSAKEALKTAFKKYPKSVTYEDGNILLEILINLKEYIDCIKICVKYLKLQLCCNEKIISSENISEIDDIKLLTANSIIYPSDWLIKLKARLSVAFINLKRFDIVQLTIEEIILEPTEVFGDYFIEIGEAFIHVKKEKIALPILETLLQTPKYSVETVWLFYGHCLNAIERFEESVRAYKNALKINPKLTGPRLTLASILDKIGRRDEAIEVLDESRQNSELEPNLLYKHAQMLFDANRMEEFVFISKLILDRHFTKIENQAEIDAMIGNKRCVNHCEALKGLRKTMGETVSSPSKYTYAKSGVSIEEEWKIYFRLCQILFKEKRYPELLRVAVSALCSDFSKDEGRRNDIDFICLMATIYNGNFDYAFNLVRNFDTRIESNRFWNIFAYVISKSYSHRHNRYLLRSSVKHPNSIPLSILNGHNCLTAGTYDFSLAEYADSYKKDRLDPFHPFLLGVTYTHITCQRYTASKNYLVVTAMSFFKQYLELRGECQEVFYNHGRALHQLNLLTQAIFYYKKALETPPPVLVKSNDRKVTNSKKQKLSNDSVIENENKMPKCEKKISECEETIIENFTSIKVPEIKSESGENELKRNKCSLFSKSEEQAVNDDVPKLDLTREIAFNLAVIYKKSGNFDLARHYIKKYIVFD